MQHRSATSVEEEAGAAVVGGLNGSGTMAVHRSAQERGPCSTGVAGVNGWCTHVVGKKGEGGRELSVSHAQVVAKKGRKDNEEEIQRWASVECVMNNRIISSA